MNELRLVFATFPTMDSARQIGTSLVEMQLAACVNFIPGVESVFRWQDKIESSAEILAIIKTSTAVLDTLEAELRRMHPYELPEFIVIEPDHASSAYSAWVIENVALPGA